MSGFFYIYAMVTFYDEKDLTQFAEWFAAQIKSGEKKASPNGEYYVTDADFLKWKEQK